MKGLWWFTFCLIIVLAEPRLALATDPPTCQLNNKNGLVNQTLCYGETVKIKATSSDENATLQWYRQHNSGNGWVAVTGATQSELTTGPGIYKAIFTFGDNSTCETENDTIDNWKAYQIDWNVAACRASISGVTPLPFPAQLVGASEINTPIDPNAEITYGWQVIPTPVQAVFTTSSNSIFPLTDGFFQDTTLGLHQVILTVSQQGSSCISQDAMEVTLLPLQVWADTIISYGGQPAIAVAHASGGTEPYTYTWTNVDSCLTESCNIARLNSCVGIYKLSSTDSNGCTNEVTLKNNGTYSLMINGLQINGGENEIINLTRDSIKVYIPNQVNTACLVDSFRVCYDDQTQIDHTFPFYIKYKNKFSPSQIEIILFFSDGQKDTTKLKIKAEFTCGSTQNFLQVIPTNLPQFTYSQIQLAPSPRRFPVVFHVLHKSKFDSIPGEVFDQILSRMNLEFNTIPNLEQFSAADLITSIYNDLAGVPKFEFYYATIDNCGQPINGRAINYKKSPSNVFSANGYGALDRSLGGITPWDQKSYINIYVYDILEPYIGMGTFPWYPLNNQSIHLNINNISTLNGVEIHELGHFFGLRHIWGDTTCGNDYVEDTPIQLNPFRNLVFPFSSCDTNVFSSCYFQPTPLMTYNFMDYSPCRSMFTEGQCVRMKTFSEYPITRESLDGNPDVYFASFQIQEESNNCAGAFTVSVADFQEGSIIKWYCPGSTTPEVIDYSGTIQVVYDGYGKHNIRAEILYAPIDYCNYSDTLSVWHSNLAIQLPDTFYYCNNTQTLVLKPAVVQGNIDQLWAFKWYNLPGNQFIVGWSTEFESIEEIYLQVSPSDIFAGKKFRLWTEFRNSCFANDTVTIFPLDPPTIIVSTPVCEPLISLAVNLNQPISGVTYGWTRGQMVDSTFQSISDLGNFSIGVDTVFISDTLFKDLIYRLKYEVHGCEENIFASARVFNQIFEGGPTIFQYSVNGGDAQPGTQSGNDTLRISLCPFDQVGFVVSAPNLISSGQYWQGEYQWSGDGPIAVEQDGSFAEFSTGVPGVYSFDIQTNNGPCLSPVRTIQITVLPIGTLTLVPWCDENGRYVRVSGGTPPYFIKKTTQANYTEMDISDPNDANAYLFAYAGPDSPLDPGLAGDYLVKDSGPGTCGNLTPFKIWGNYGTLPHVEMHGVNFVQYDLTFNKATIADGATVYMYGTHQYHSGSTAGGTVGGATLIKTGTGDFIIGNGASITSQCGEMWPGIKISNSDLYQRVIGDGARIEHAETAFEFLNQNAATKLTLSACTLANNFNGIRIHQNNLTNWIMTNSIMYTDENGLLPPYDDARNSSLGSDKTFEGNYGIQFVKGNGTATNSLSLTGTTIRNYMVGIDGYGAWFSADNCIFDKIRLAGINSYVSSFTGNPITINHCSFNLNAADAFTSQRTALRNDANFVANSSLEPIGTFGIVANNAPFAITGNTTFEGKAGIFDDSKPRVGYHSNVSETIEENTFKNLDFGYFNEGVTGSLSLQGTTFENNTRSIYLNGGQIALDLRCNVFKTDDAIARTGLQIGSGVTIENDGIGGNGGIDQPLPNANIWPRKPNVTPATSPDNWISIQKPDAGGELFYYQFNNEFLGTIVPVSGPNYIFPSPHKVAKSPKAVREWCEATFTGSQVAACIVDPMNMAGWNSQWVAVCENLDDQHEYFPARQAVSNGITASIEKNTEDQIYLSDPIPNPSKETAAIDLNWPKEKGKLVVFELGSGKAKWSTSVAKGRHRIIVPVKGITAGVYGYRLEGECPCPEPKRLIVIH